MFEKYPGGDLNHNSLSQRSHVLMDGNGNTD